jgi:glycine/D-amino acid oxidase-like deaminating enzyme
MQLDAIIVGAGIIGTSILHKLLSHSISAVAFDAPDSSYASASTAAGAMLGAFGEITALQNAPMDEVETQFRVDCANVYEDWLDSISSDSVNRPKISRGTFIIANAQGKDDINNINAIGRAAERFGTPHEWCDSEDIKFLRPHQSMRPYKILHLADEGYIDAIKLLSYMKSASLGLSPNPFIRETVQRLITDGDSVIGVQDSNGHCHYSACVILCCGVNSLPLILKSAISKHGVPALFGGKGSSATITTELNFSHVIRTPNRDFACGTHIVPRDDGSYYLVVR